MNLDELPDAVVVLDGDGRVVEDNATAHRLAGEDGGGASAQLSLRRPDGRPASTGWPAEATEQELVLTRPDGSEVRVRATARHRRGPDGKAMGVVVALRPIGEATGIEVVSTVSHELRSPLTSVKGFTSLLLNRWDRLDDDQKRMMLEQIHHDADRVTRLVTELLDISRLETGRLVLRRQLVDLPALVASVVHEVTVAYPALECDLDVDAGFPRVLADPDKLEQVVTNLVENAAKYANPKGLRIHARAGAGEVAVSVQDQGEGIPAEDLPLVFTKFFRRDHGRPTGTGLGLWISRGLVEAHGGQLTADSTPGQGTTFCFTLPLDIPDPAAP